MRRFVGILEGLFEKVGLLDGRFIVSVNGPIGVVFLYGLTSERFEGGVTVFFAVGVDEDTVDLLESNDSGLVADGLDERAQTGIAGPA